MSIIEFTSDRTIDSTDNNEYAEGDRDETLIDEDLFDVDIPTDDRISDAADESGEGSRPIYDEEGWAHNPDEY